MGRPPRSEKPNCPLQAEYTISQVLRIVKRFFANGNFSIYVTKTAPERWGRLGRLFMRLDLFAAGSKGTADAHSDDQHQVGCQGEGRHVDDEAQGIGHTQSILHVGIDGQVGIGIGAEVEHIEEVLLQQTAAVGPLIKAHSDSHHRGKNGDGLENGLILRLDVTRAQEINTDGDHRAVADHGLDIDADGFDKHVAGIHHHAQAGKHRIGGEVGTQGVVNLSLAEQTHQQTHVHRRGAELEGEGAPREGIGDAILVRKAEIDHLVDLQHQHDDGGGEDDGGGVLFAVFEAEAQQDARRNGENNKEQMEPTVSGRLLHTRVKKFQNVGPKHRNSSLFDILRPV